MAAVRAVAASLAIALIAVAYLPFLASFRGGCISGCDGTASRNLHSLAHNYAAAGGSRGDCPKSWRRHRLSDVIYVRVTLLLRRLVMKRQGWTSKLPTPLEQRQHIRAELFIKCVDPSEFTLDAATFQTACRDGEELTNAASLDPFAVFDCDQLPKCEATCIGPVRRVLAPLAHSSACAAEGAIHAAGLRTVIVAFVFFSANAARDIAVRGVTAVSWRKLSGDSGFHFQGSLRADGTTLKPETSGRPVRQVARAKLRNVAKRHELGGYGLIILALMSQAPGIVALFFARGVKSCDRSRLQNRGALSYRHTPSIKN